MPGPGHARMPDVIALDCEMCQTDTDPSALLCLSIVNGRDPAQCLLHTLVRPRAMLH